MSYTYIKDIKCFGCGGTELEQQHILNGFTRCACKTCGSKFIVQCEGSDVVDKYIADRGIISAAMETAVIDERELNDVPDELKNLVNKYSAIVDLDPVYHWYKIVLLTNNFKDFTKFKEAEREYKKVSESYVVCATDKTLTDSYERVYKSYCHEYFKQQDIVNNRKKKKKKKALAFSLIGILIIIISVILSVSLYIPSLKDEKTGIRVKLNNKAYGLFGKYSVSLYTENIAANTLKYNVVDAALSDSVGRYEVYELNIFNGDVIAEPKSSVSVTIPLTAGYNKECIGVYYFDNSGNNQEITDFSVSDESINFNMKKFGLYAVAEKKIKVTFDAGEGNSIVVQMVEWGSCVIEPEAHAEKFGYFFDGWYNGEIKYNFSLAVAQELMLTARWTRDPKYDGYTYISTAEELKSISANTSGQFLLLNDIDMGGESWSVISTFKGTFDGACHTVYNFNITSSAFYNDTERNIGFFGQLLSGSTVKNLQIGKKGATTKIECAPWQQQVYAGLIAGYSSGNVINCRGVNCTISVKVSAQEDKHKNAEFAGNVGGICGVVRNGTVSRCYVADCNFRCETWSRYNNISNVARCAGIASYTDNATVSDCLIKNNTFVSDAKTEDSALFNKVGQPFAVGGGVIGHAVSTTVTRTVVSSNNISATKSVGSYSNGEGAIYRGCMIGFTNSTTPSNMVGVNTSINPSGSNASYPGFTRINENSLSALINVSAEFANGYWIENDGAIALLF